MKIRNGFVSNSSSSSFMIYHGNIEEISLSMLDTILEDFESPDWGKTKKQDLLKHRKWIKNLHTALKRKYIREGKFGITMPSCNYDTYLIIKDNYLYIATCNNHQWDISDTNYENSDNHDRIYDVVRSSYFYDVTNKMIHSYEMFVENGEKNECPKCDHYYGNYVMDQKGNRLCGSCLSKLGPTEADKMETLRTKVSNDFKNPITSLKIDE